MPDAGNGEGDLELGEERAEHVPDARLLSERQAVDVRAADEDAVGTEGQRPVDVGPVERSTFLGLRPLRRLILQRRNAAALARVLSASPAPARM